MKRCATMAVVSALILVSMMSERARAVNPVYTIDWVGGSSGEWNDANAWRNRSTGVTSNATTLMGTNRGSEGMNNIEPTVTAARHIVIGDGAAVDYAISLANTSGLRLRQGTTLTIKDGATWEQDISGLPQGSGWFECRCDPSDLIIDSGTFRRTGEGTEETSTGSGIFVNVGGGNMLLASYNDDNNLQRLGTLPPRAKVEIKNGGRLENTGQLWFGTDGESSFNTRVTMTINDGHLDLTGGQFPIENGEMTGLGGVVGDLAFFYDHRTYFITPLSDPPVVNPDAPSGFQNEEYQINFTGPGSIKVDSTGIRVLRQPAPPDPMDPTIESDWTGRDVQVSYQDLWNQGILKANGLSGAMGEAWSDSNNPRILQPANFDNFFTITGTPGTDDYTLTAKPATTLATVEWVGGASGEWNDANAWRNTTTGVTSNAQTLMGSNRGSEGMNNVDPALTAARHIVIGGGATVDYNSAVQGGLRLRQGTTLTIKDGATWVQDISDHPQGSGWDECRCDPSEVILDGGTFRRTGEGTEETSTGSGIFVNVGGGNMLFGSYNDDNNLQRLGTLPPRANVEIKNGGRLENTGQLWFGTDGESSFNTRVTFTINDGHLDLTGGQFPIENGEMTGLGGVVGDLAFFYDHRTYFITPLSDPPVVNPDAPSGFQNEEYEINFTGPGSITVDSAGIRVLRQPAPPDPMDPTIESDWTGRDVQVSYQDLWNQGILKANGLSGAMGEAWSDSNNPRILQPADFNDFFTVTGMPGMDDYILTSLIEATPAPGLDGDYNGDGKVDAADYVVWRKNPAGFGGDPAGYNTWRANFGNMAGSGSSLGSASVPEPASAVMLLMGTLAMCLRRRAA